MQLDNPTADREAEPAALDFRAGSLLQPHEAVKDVLALRARYAATFVLQLDTPQTVAHQRTQPDVTAGGRSIDGVGEEV